MADWEALIELCRAGATEDLGRHVDGRDLSVGEMWEQERQLLRPLGGRKPSIQRGCGDERWGFPSLWLAPAEDRWPALSERGEALGIVLCGVQRTPERIR